MKLFKILKICKCARYLSCYTDPPHPNRSKNGLYPLHRVIMENYLGRLLSIKELVHHKNHNKEDNRIKNLELTNNSQHGKIHNPERKIVILCEECGEEFKRIPSQIKYNEKRNAKNFCSKRCAAKYYFKLNT